jgi:hypothetical protein
MIRQAGHVRMEMHLAPTSCESHLLRGRDVLVAEENHAVLEQGLVNRAERLIIDFPQIDAE